VTRSFRSLGCPNRLTSRRCCWYSTIFTALATSDEFHRHYSTSKWPPEGVDTGQFVSEVNCYHHRTASVGDLWLANDHSLQFLYIHVFQLLCTVAARWATRGNAHGSRGIPMEMGMNKLFMREWEWEWYFGNGNGLNVGLLKASFTLSHTELITSSKALQTPVDRLAANLAADLHPTNPPDDWNLTRPNQIHGWTQPCHSSGAITVAYVNHLLNRKLKSHSTRILY